MDWLGPATVPYQPPVIRVNVSRDAGLESPAVRGPLRVEAQRVDDRATLDHPLDEGAIQTVGERTLGRSVRGDHRENRPPQIAVQQRTPDCFPQRGVRREVARPSHDDMLKARRRAVTARPRSPRSVASPRPPFPPSRATVPG